LHTLPAQQVSPKEPQLVVPLLLPLVEVLQELVDVPDTDAVCPLYVHVMVQLEPLPPTEHDAPLPDSVPQRHTVCPFALALQHAGVLPPEHPATTTNPRATAAKQATHPRMTASTYHRPVRAVPSAVHAGPSAVHVGPSSVPLVPTGPDADARRDDAPIESRRAVPSRCASRGGPISRAPHDSRGTNGPRPPVLHAEPAKEGPAPVRGGPVARVPGSVPRVPTGPDEKRSPRFPMRCAHLRKIDRTPKRRASFFGFSMHWESEERRNPMSRDTKQSTVTADAALKQGIDQKYPGTTWVVQGQPYTTAQIDALLDKRIAANKESDQKHADWLGSCDAAKLVMRQTSPIVRAVEQRIRAENGNDPAALAEFGLKPLKKGKRTAQSKAQAADKALATRKRHGAPPPPTKP
jgi:hypothetical protein